MLIPIILTDLCTLAPGATTDTAVPCFTFRTEEAARRVLVVLQGEIAAGRMESAGASLMLVPRAATVDVASFAAASTAGYAIDDATVQAAWAQATQAVVEEPAAPAPVVDPLPDPLPDPLADPLADPQPEPLP